MAINVFSLVLAVVLGFNFYVLRGDLFERQSRALEHLTTTDKALNKLDVFTAELKTRPRLKFAPVLTK